MKSVNTSECSDNFTFLYWSWQGLLNILSLLCMSSRCINTVCMVLIIFDKNQLLHQTRHPRCETGGPTVSCFHVPPPPAPPYPNLTPLPFTPSSFLPLLCSLLYQLLYSPLPSLPQFAPLASSPPPCPVEVVRYAEAVLLPLINQRHSANNLETLLFWDASPPFPFPVCLAPGGEDWGRGGAGGGITFLLLLVLFICAIIM